MSIETSTVRNVQVHTYDVPPGVQVDLSDVVEKIFRNLAQWIVSGFRPQMSKEFYHNFRQWIDARDAATIDYLKACQDVDELSAHPPTAPEEMPEYEARLAEEKRIRSEKRDECIRASENLTKKIDAYHLKEFYKNRKFNKKTRKELKKIHASSEKELRIWEREKQYEVRFTGFEQHSKVVFKEKASDEERSAALKIMEEDGNALLEILTEMAKTASSEQLRANLVAQHTFVTKHLVDARFFAAPIANNLSELGALKGQNPSEYIHKSALFQQKLIGDEQFTHATHFGEKWIAETPKEASNEEIVWMGEFFLTAARALKKEGAYVNASGYRQKIEQVIRDRRLTLNEDPATSSEEAKNMQRMRGMLFVLDGDLSFDAEKCYEHCTLFENDRAAWIAMRARFYVSCLRWEEAKQQITFLAETSPEIAEELKKHIVYAQEELCTITIDSADLVISKLAQFLPKEITNKVPKRSRQIWELTTVAARPLWKRFLVSYPEKLETSKFDLIFSSYQGLDFTLSLIPSTFLAEMRKFSDSSAQLGFNAWRFRNMISSPTTTSTLMAPTQLANAVGSFGTLGIQGMRKWGKQQSNPAAFAVFGALQHVSSDMSYLSYPFKILSFGNAVMSLPKYFGFDMASRTTQTLRDWNLPAPAYLTHRVTRISTDTYERIAKKVTWSPQKLMLVGSACAVGVNALLRFSFTSPKLWAKVVMENAIYLCYAQQFETAKEQLQKAQQRCWSVSGWWDGHKIVLEKYEICIDFYKIVSQLNNDKESKERFENGAKTLDPPMQILAPVAEYKIAHDELLFQRILGAFKVSHNERFKQYLLEAQHNEKLLGRSLISCVHHAEAQPTAESTASHLELVGQAFPKAYEAVLNAYRIYVEHKNASQRDAQNIVKAIDEIIRCAENAEGLSDLVYHKRWEKICLLVDTSQFRDMCAELQKGEWPANALASLALQVIANADSAFVHGAQDLALSQLEQARKEKGFPYRTFIEKYRDYLLARKDHATTTTQQLHEVIDSVLAEIQENQDFAMRTSALQEAKFDVYLDDKDYKSAAAFLRTLQQELHSKLAKKMITKMCVEALAALKQNEDVVPHFVTALQFVHGFPYSDILTSLHDFVLSTTSSIDERLSKIDLAIDKVGPISELSNWSLELYNHKVTLQNMQDEPFISLLQMNKFQEAKAFMQQAGDAVTRDRLVGKFAVYIIDRRDRGLSENRNVFSVQTGLKQVIQEMGLENHSLMQACVVFLSAFEKAEKRSNEIKLYQDAQHAINQFSSKLQAFHTTVCISLIITKLNLHRTIARFAYAQGNETLAVQESQAAHNLSLEMQNYQKQIQQQSKRTKE